MSKKTYLALLKNFEEELESFLNKEARYEKSKSLGKIKPLEAEISGLENQLTKFADLHYNIAIEAAEDTGGARADTLDAIRVVMTRLEYLYLMPLNHRLNYLNNKKNLWIAYAAIFISVLGAAISVVPFCLKDANSEILQEVRATEKTEKLILHLDSAAMAKKTAIIDSGTVKKKQVKLTINRH